MDASSTAISRCVDTVLSIYQGGSLSSTIKNLTGRNSQDVRETIEQLIKQFETLSSSSSIDDVSTPQQTQFNEPIKQTPLMPNVPPTTPASALNQREQIKSSNSNNDGHL